MSIHIKHKMLKHKHSELKGIGPDDHHRKLSWADEQGYCRNFIVPLTGKRVGANQSGDGGWTRVGQVLDVGASGNWDDAHVEVFSVLKVGDEVWLYYGGRTLLVYEGVGLAISSADPPTSGFSRYGTDGKILSRGSAGDPDADGVTYPAVVYDGDVDLFKMWYQGFENGSVNRYICYATSNDGKSWTRRSPPNIYTLAGDELFQTLVKVGKYYLAIVKKGNSQFKALIGNDGINFTDEGVILQSGAAGEWDENRIEYPSLWWNLGTWYLPYSARNDAGVGGFGLALSTNGYDFEKFKMNPFYRDSATGFDSVRVYSPQLIMIEDTFYLYYDGYDGSKITIGVATLP